MLNRALYRKEWKSNWKLLVIFYCILSMYSIMIIYMFDPSMGDSLKIMAESMPEIFAAFGMAEVGQTLLEFITGYLYGFLFTVFPAVMMIILANKLIAKYVDDGSMVYLLSTPNTRNKIVRTQGTFLVTFLLGIFVLSVLTIMITSAILFPGELEVPAFIRASVGLFGVWMMIGGVCFLFSCIFNESQKSSGCSTAFVVYSLLAQMISQVGDKFEKLKYATPFSLFQIDGLVANEGTAWTLCAITYVVGIVCIVLGTLIFDKKDLPI